MAPQKVTFLIVPGSFCTPPAYDVLIDKLQGQGYAAWAVELLSANDGTRQPPATGADDAAHIRQAILSVLDDEAAPSDVVLAVHSYGGMPGTSAPQGLGRADRSAQGKHTAVVGLVYMASFLIPLGQSNREFMSAEADVPEAARVAVPGGYLPAISPSFMKAIFNDVPLSEEGIIDRYSGAFTRHSSDSFDYKIPYEAWKDIPSVDIIPGNDLIVPTKVQLTMFERAVAAGGKVTKVFVEGAGHAINVSQPELVAAEMIKLAEAQS